MATVDVSKEPSFTLDYCLSPKYHLFPLTDLALPSFLAMNFVTAAVFMCTTIV